MSIGQFKMTDFGTYYTVVIWVTGVERNFNGVYNIESVELLLIFQYHFNDGGNLHGAAYRHRCLLVGYAFIIGNPLTHSTLNRPKGKRVCDTRRVEI